VKININHATNQVFIGIHCRCMVTVFPKGSIPVLATVESLGCSSGHKLQRTRNNIMIFISIHEQMDVV
jgi:hypothetical protein